MIQAAVLGYGTVGSGVVEVIEENRSVIKRNVGEELHVKYILDLRDFPGDPYEKKVIHDFTQIMEDDEVKIVCETMGGVGAAYAFTKQALAAGKSVCTSNKELVAAHGPELLALAAAHKCSYLFEASVGGGIPIIRTLNNALTADRIEAITGILNGTTNYILSKMEKEGASFEAVLKEAQEKGYAERNPEADVEGYDTCRKIAILSSLMTGKSVNYEKIYTEGITKITARDFAYARALGMSIKLLAISRRVGEETLAMTAPFLISSDSPLYTVNGVFNAVLVKGNMLGESMYYGRGAGKLPTASAVAADVVDCARHMGETLTCFWDAGEAALVSMDNVARRFFFRVKAGCKERIEKLFGEGLQEIQLPEASEETGYVTGVMKEKEFAALYEQIADVLAGSRIRIEA